MNLAKHIDVTFHDITIPLSAVANVTNTYSCAVIARVILIRETQHFHD